jgi:hypothetical protein
MAEGSKRENKSKMFGMQLFDGFLASLKGLSGDINGLKLILLDRSWVTTA